MANILVVEDDIKYQIFLKELLEVEGYQVMLADNAIDGIKLFKEQIYDLVISDLKMESIDGNQFLALLRKLNDRVKVIILTGSNDTQDEVESLDLQASDFIRKPVAVAVLLKRIERVLHEDKVLVEKELSSQQDNIFVDLKKRKVYKNEQYVSLGEKEYHLLVYFLKHKNVTLSRTDLLENVWRTTEHLIDARTVDTHVKKIRTKLRLSSIYSIRGIGYEWVE